jgi:putative ABC transport system permease protein
LIHLVFAGLRHRLLRSFTAIAAVATALAVLTLTAAGIKRGRDIAQSTPDFLTITSANSELDLPISLVSRLSAVPGVESVEYYDEHLAMDTTPEHNYVGALRNVSDGYFLTVPASVIRVDPDVRERWRGEKQGLVSSRGIAARMGWKTNDIVSLTWKSVLTGETFVTPFKLLGVYEGADPETLIVHYDYVDQLLTSQQHGRVFLAAVSRKTPGEEAVDEGVQRVLREMAEPVMAISAREWMDTSVSGELTSTRLLEKVAFVMIAITCAVVGAAISMSLRERRSELATLRAVGFSRTRLFALILGEATLTGAAGYALGVLLPTALLVAMGTGVDLGATYLSGVRPGGAELALAAAAAAILAAAISVWPAWSASRQDVVLALQEG